MPFVARSQLQNKQNPNRLIPPSKFLDSGGRTNFVYRHILVRLSRVLAFAILLFGLTVYLGLIGPSVSIRQILADNTKPDSVLCCALCAAALLLGPLARPSCWKRGVALLCRLVVLIMTAGRLLEEAFGYHGIAAVPHWFAPILPDSPMAPHSAAALLFDALAIGLLARGPRQAIPCQLLALTGLSIGFFGMIGYLLHAQVFISIFNGARLLPLTIVALMMLGVAILGARPNRGMIAVFLRDNASGIVARRLFAPAVLAPVLVGWISYTGWRTNYYDAGFACTLIVVSSIAIACIVTIGSVVALNRSDLERRRLVEAQLQSDARERGAREASRIKSDFVANVSHELRTPMNGVLGMTSLLLDSDLTPEQREQAETIRQSGDALLTLVNEILDFSKIEAGKIEFEAKRFSIQACLDEVVALLSTAARRGRVNFIAHVATATPTTLIGDVSRIRQVLINLIGNALKFTDEGEVVVDISLPLRPDGRHNLRCDVIDTGIGISSAQLERLFQPFHQADNSATRRHGGTGLGLAICKRLVELMDGTIGVTSHPGQGSAFRFTIPLEASQNEIRPQADPLPENTTLVLISPAGRYTTILKQEFESWGARVFIVEDPFALAQLPTCHAVLLDRQCDAVGLASRMQLDPVWSNTPRVLVDFDDPLTDEEATLFTKHLLKPLKRSHLAAALRDLCGDAAELKVRRVATQPLLAITQPLRILLAEDNFINQKVAVALLGRFGYRCDLAANGVEAVDCVLRQPYDLILLDIQMPEMDGVEAAAAIRRKLRSRCPKLVALTANAFPGARDQYLAQGFDDYLSKPILSETLQRILSDTRPTEPLRSPSTRLLVPSGRREAS